MSIGVDDPARPEAVFAFWFSALDQAPVRQPAAPMPLTQDWWFKKSDATDAIIRTRFAAVVEAALAGDFATWTRTPASALALIIVLDQLPRNIFRDQARAFAGDARALATARALVDRSDDRTLAPVQRWFAYMPFEHAEDHDAQNRSVALFERLARDGLSEPLPWAIRHRDVIARFGRFPHRNAILGRASTADEAAFLGEAGSRF